MTITYMETYVLTLTHAELCLEECERLSKEFKRIKWYQWNKARKNIKRRTKLLDTVEYLSNFREWVEGPKAEQEVERYTRNVLNKAIRSSKETWGKPQS